MPQVTHQSGDLLQSQLKKNSPMTGNGISTVDALLFRAAILWGRLATSRVGRKKLCWEVLSTSAPNGVRNAAFAGMIPVAVAALQVAAEPGVGLLVKIYGHSIHGTEGKMTKRMVSGLFIGLGMLVVANVAAWAQASNDGVITINGGRNSVLMSAPSQTITLAAGPSPELAAGLDKAFCSTARSIPRPRRFAAWTRWEAGRN